MLGQAFPVRHGYVSTNSVGGRAFLWTEDGTSVKVEGTSDSYHHMGMGPHRTCPPQLDTENMPETRASSFRQLTGDHGKGVGSWRNQPSANPALEKG